MSRPFSVLVLADCRRTHANTILDHLDAFEMYSRNCIYFYDPLGRSKSEFLDLDEFDVIVIHYSICVLWDHYLGPFFREMLSKYRGLKVQFVQDDYRHINSMCSRVRELGVNVLLTLYAPDKVDAVYSPERLPNVTKYTTLAGYIPENLVAFSKTTTGSRPIDIGFRSRKTPYWLGKLGNEKTQIVEAFHQHVKGHPITHDVSSRECDRIYGTDWPAFVRSCKTMLGTESGSSITDFDGSVQSSVEAYLKVHPNASFEEVHQAILQPYEGNVVDNCISPRAFESAALRTGMVLYPGEYSGILKPWVHYIPLEKDFSNFAEVVDKVKDAKFVTDLTDRCYDDLVASGRYSYETFVREFDEMLDRHTSHRCKTAKVNYRKAIMEPIPSPKFTLLKKFKNKVNRVLYALKIRRPPAA